MGSAKGDKGQATRVTVVNDILIYRHTLMLQIFLVVRFVHLEIICR